MKASMFFFGEYIVIIFFYNNLFMIDNDINKALNWFENNLKNGTSKLKIPKRLRLNLNLNLR